MARPRRESRAGDSPAHGSATRQKRHSVGRPPRDRDTAAERERLVERVERVVEDDGGRERERYRERERQRQRARRAAARGDDSEKTRSTNSESHLLSENSLAQLDAANRKTTSKTKKPKEQLRPPKVRAMDEKRPQQQNHHHQHKKKKSGKKRRVASGPALEAQRSGKRHSEGHSRKRRIWIAIIVVLLLLAIIIPVAVVVAKKKSSADSGGGSSSGGAAPANSNLASIDKASIPDKAKGTILDPFSWYDTGDFNVTYTDEKVGGLPVMGLNSTWDDKTRASKDVPPLDEEWEYGSMPIRGVNVGGWLSIEPFITPSLFDRYSEGDNVVDEYTLSRKLGDSAKSTLESHYSSFVTEQTFADIAAAGLDHVRIPYSYWAVTTYPGDPYVAQVSWRYLLRGIEWARKHGLRVNLDLHGAPGSQNGWNHSGRQGVIGWLNGTDGELNAQRTLDLHDQLSTFFAQPRYKNVVTIYGLLNEPRMLNLDATAVRTWSSKAISQIQGNGIKAVIAVSDGFLPPSTWQGQLSSAPSKSVAIDSHQYQIFNQDQIAFAHTKKIDFACDGLSDWMAKASNTATGFGSTFCGEWSQADTDCARYLNNVNTGTRWEGDLILPDPKLSVTKPLCPTKDRRCSCADANADPSAYSDSYKAWLRSFAQAQMQSYESGWGWFYWTWDTETAVQWSYKKAIAAGIMPAKARERDFDCAGDTPGFTDLSETY